MAKETYNGHIKVAHDPIFAPITYGDDRQVTRTRRGIHCQIENNLDPNLVYCKCETCNYQWIMDKRRYVTGTGGIGGRPNPTNIHNIGIGGTGLWIGNFIDPKTKKIKYPTLPEDVTVHYDYDPVDGKYYGRRNKQYTHLAHDDSYCYSTTIECDEEGYIHTYDFYPLTGGTGRDGTLIPEVVHDLYYDPVTGGLRGDKNSAYLGAYIPVYVKCTEEDDWLATTANYIAPKWPPPWPPSSPGARPLDWPWMMSHLHYGGYRYHLNKTIINHPGGSGTYGGEACYKNEVHVHPLPRMFGGYPMACPHCCKVNFLAKWLEINDRPNPYGDYQHLDPGSVPSQPSPIPILSSENEFLSWMYKNKYLGEFRVTTPSTTWYITSEVFKEHVGLLVFSENGILIPQENIDKIQLNHVIGALTIQHPDAISGYVWAVRPFTEMPDYIDNIDNVCTGIIVRDHQRIKDHLNDV